MADQPANQSDPWGDDALQPHLDIARQEENAAARDAALQYLQGRVVMLNARIRALETERLEGLARENARAAEPSGE